MRFAKMHGLGNDFVMVDGFEENFDESTLSQRAIQCCDRHFGIGADGLILILPSRVANFRMRIFNPDGSEAEASGNGIRCFAKYVYERRKTQETSLTVETPGGIQPVRLTTRGGKVESVRADIGTPQFTRKAIPMRGPETGEAIRERFRVDGERFEATCLSLGNPHCVLFVDRIETFPVARYGPQIERHNLFPKRTNVAFVQVLNTMELRVRVWERGGGESLGGGTGACAAVVASAKVEKTARRVTVHLVGGELRVEWSGDDHVYLAGPADEVFTGEIN
jgi:diaminopimelate epimerase